MSVSEVLFRVFGTLPYIYEHTWRLRLLPKIWITSVSRLICIMFWSVRNLKRLYWNDKTYFHFVDFNQRFFVANRIMYISIFISTWIRLGFLPKNQVESSLSRKHWRSTTGTRNFILWTLIHATFTFPTEAWLSADVTKKSPKL